MTLFRLSLLQAGLFRQVISLLFQSSLFLSIIFILWLFFFFKQKTAYEMRISDWSSDVCSSDLADEQPEIFMTDRLAHQESRQQPHDEAADEVDRQDAPRIARHERVQRPLADELARPGAERAADHEEARSEEPTSDI